MIGVLTGLGLAASAAVWIASLRGIGQSLARLAQVLFGGRLHPLDLNLAAALVLTAASSRASPAAGSWPRPWPSPSSTAPATAS